MVRYLSNFGHSIFVPKRHNAKVNASVRKISLHFLILSTFYVGFSMVAYAQVDTSRQFSRPDSSRISNPRIDSAKAALPRDSGKFKLSTDSVYATPFLTPTEKSLLPSLVEYTAKDSIVGNLLGGDAYLYNEAYVKYEQLELQAGYIYVNFETKEVLASGIRDTAGNVVQKPVFTESGKAYRADTMRYNFDTKKAKIKRVITKEGEGYLHGEDVKKVDDKTFYIKNASYTTCSHEDPHFKINTPKAKVISGDKIITQFAYIEILDIPTPLMVPFGFFPTTSERKSGLILPAYGNSDFRGYFLTNGGYYWAINDYLDLTVTGDIYTQGGYGLRASTTYRKRYRYGGSFGASFNKIKFGREEFADFGSAFFSDEDNFSVNWNHNQDAKARPDFRFNANVNVSSRNNNRLNGDNVNEILNNQLASSISVQKTWPSKPYNLSVSLNHNQNNQANTLTLKLPEANFSWNRFFPFRRQVSAGRKRWYEEIGVSYNATGRNQITTALDEPFFTEENFVQNARNGIQHTLPIGANYRVLQHFVLNPSINYTERWYFQRSEYAFNPETNNAEVVDTTNGFYGVRDFRTGANLTTNLYGTFRYNGFVRAIRHKMTPTVGLSYIPDFSTDFWGYYQEVQVDEDGTTERLNRYTNGIYGSPGSAEQGNVNFGLLNTLEAKIRDKQDSTGLRKVRLLERLSLNASYNMAAEKFNWSQIRLNMSSSAFNNLLNAQYDASYSVYGVNTETNQQTEEFAHEVNDRWLRTTSQSFALGLNLNATRFNKGKKKKVVAPPQGLTEDQEKGVIDEIPPQRTSGLGITGGDVDYYRERGFVDFTVPWSLNINYNLNISYQALEPTLVQTTEISGDFELTENWRIGFRTGYDLKARQFTFTSFDFYRDLHCWDLRAQWVPFGFRQSYTLTIRVKASTLKDLKLERRRQGLSEGGGAGGGPNLPTLPGF